MRYELKTTKGFIIIEDKGDKLVAYFVEGNDITALTQDSTKLKHLGEVDRKEIRRLGRSV